MKTLLPTRLVTSPIFAAILWIGMLSGEAHSAALKESYDIAPDAGLEKISEKLPIWKLQTSDGVSTLLYGDKEQVSPTAPAAIRAGSLSYTDEQKRSYPAAGNRLRNPGSERILLHQRFKLNLNDSSLSAGSLDDTSSRAENLERSRPGWGAPNQTLWFSILILPNSAPMALVLANSAYSTGPNGIRFDYQVRQSLFTIRQNWLALKSAEASNASIPIQGDQPSWIVAKIETGPEWGHSTAYEKISANSQKATDPLPDPTGRLTVWINPALGKAPDPAAAVATIPLHEMRIDTLGLELGPGAEADEVRLDPTFEALTEK